MTDARDYLRSLRPQVDAALDAALPPADAPPAALHAAMRHLLFPGGKRLRPGLALAAAEAVGGPRERALPAAVAVELVHTYSLVHDDLPCMDDDAERRGRPTVHVAFGEANAVLAGDALLAAAFEALLTLPSEAGPGARLAAAADLARASGSLALVGGQADDLALDPGAATAAAVGSIHRRKTAALMAAACAAGGGLAGGDAEAIDRLRRAGEALGGAFQIADDLLDAATPEPASLVALLGPEAAHERGEALLAAALAALDGFGEAAEPLRALGRFALRRKE